MSTPSDPFSPRPTPGPGWAGGGPVPPPADWRAYGPPPRQETESKAIIALVCAVASFVVLPLVPAVVALVLASSARERIDASGGWLTGEGLVTAARVIAWVNIVLSVLLVGAVVLALVAFAGAGVTAVRL